MNLETFFTLVTLAGVALVLLTLYSMPLLVARGRRHPQTLAIGVLNVLLGWSVLGWIAALVWSCTTQNTVPSARRKI